MEKRLLFFVLTIAIAVLGCDNFAKGIESRVSAGISSALERLQHDRVLTKDTLVGLYQRALLAATDTTARRKIEDLNKTVLGASKYLDSIINELNKLDDKNLNNIDLVKTTFVYNGLGDSVFAKTALSYTRAESAALNVETKTAIIKSRNNLLVDDNAEKFSNTLFGLQGPVGAIMVLSGINNEILQMASKSLKDYSIEKARN